jgi:hypothetical protein
MCQPGLRSDPAHSPNIPEAVERTVGGGNDVLEELGGAHGAATPLDVVHGGGIRLGRLVHRGGERGESG